MKRLYTAVLVMILLLCLTGSIQAEIFGRVILPDNDAFCNKLVLVSGKETSVVPMCDQYDTIRKTAKTTILETIAEIANTYDEVDDDAEMMKILNLSELLEYNLSILESVYISTHGENEFALERTRAFNNERDINEKAIHAWAEIVRSLALTTNATRVLDDAHFELEGKLEVLDDVAMDTHMMRNEILNIKLNPPAPTREKAMELLPPEKVFKMWTSFTTFTKTLENLKEEYKTMLDKYDRDIFNNLPLAATNLEYLKTADRGLFWEEIFKLSKEDRVSTGSGFDDATQAFEELYESSFGNSLFDYFTRFGWDDDNPTDDFKEDYDWYMNLE